MWLDRSASIVRMRRAKVNIGFGCLITLGPLDISCRRRGDSPRKSSLSLRVASVHVGVGFDGWYRHDQERRMPYSLAAFPTG